MLLGLRKMQVKDTIRKLRKENNYTQVDLAEKINCNRQKIADWERGKSTPSADDLILLAKIFNTSTDYLLGLSGVASLDPEINSIHEATGLSEKAIEILKDIQLAEETYYFDMLNFLIEETGFTAFEDGTRRFNDSILIKMIEYFFYKTPGEKVEFIISSGGDIINANECDESDIQLVTDNRFSFGGEFGYLHIDRVKAAKLVESYNFEKLSDRIKKSRELYLKQEGEQHGNRSKKE